MGRTLYEQSAKAREVFERADTALGFSISRICFEGLESELTLTKHTQPAIVTTSLAALAALREAQPELPDPKFAAGHSLGEYSALVAAGALSLEDAVRIVHIRGSAMQDAVPSGQGGMAAILGGEEEAVRALCQDAAEGEVLSPANFNSPGQIVIAGHATAIERAANLAKTRSLKAIPLKVSAPFHCALMAPAAERVREALSQITIHAPRFPVVANVDATAHSQANEIADLLVRQVDSAVLWDRSIQNIAASGVQKALEIGPGKVLAGLVKRIDKSWVVKNIGTAEDLPEVADFFA